MHPFDSAPQESPSMMARLLAEFHAEHPEHRRIFLADVRREGRRLVPYDPLACPALRDPEAAP